MSVKIVVKAAFKELPSDFSGKDWVLIRKHYAQATQMAETLKRMTGQSSATYGNNYLGEIHALAQQMETDPAKPFSGDVCREIYDTGLFHYPDQTFGYRLKPVAAALARRLITKENTVKELPPFGRLASYGIAAAV